MTKQTNNPDYIVYFVLNRKNAFWTPIRAAWNHKDGKGLNIETDFLSRDDNSAFKDCEKIGGVPVRRFTGEYTPGGDQVYTDGKLYWDTIYRFKGQQAPAVILVDVDESLGDSEYARRVLYCGMTRATVRLEMVVHRDNHWLQALERAT